jgi:hypothetical protein
MGMLNNETFRANMKEWEVINNETIWLRKGMRLSNIREKDDILTS